MRQLKKPDLRPIVRIFLCAAFLCGFFAFSDALATPADPAFLFTQPPTVNPVPTVTHQGNLFCPYNYDGLTGRIVECIQNIIIEAVKNFLDDFLVYYEAIVYAALILAVTLYGVMLLLGSVRRPTGDTFFFIFKLAAVAFFSIKFGGMVEYVFALMKGLLSIVTNYVTVSSLGACSSESHLADFFKLHRDVITVWDKVDCMFMTMLGITSTQTGAFGLIALMIAILPAGGIGIMMFFMLIMLMFTLLLATLRGVKIYLVSVATLAFLIAMSWLIIPCLLFSHTKPIFDKGMKNFANSLVIPIFLFAYLSMIVAAYDAILFKGQYSLFYAIASEASQTKNFSLGDWLFKGVDGDGNVVGRDVPGLDAITIMTYIERCNNATQEEKDELKDICDSDLETLLNCSINPKIPVGGKIEINAENTDCRTLKGEPYYGFMRNEEIFYFVISPNIETEREARKRREGCGWNLFCHGKKFRGEAFNFARNVVGSIQRAAGNVGKALGRGIQVVGVASKDVCHFTLVPGIFCDAQGNAVIAAGNIVHAQGTFVNFTGRVMMNGLLAELGKVFESWVDVDAIDFQKVASYHCKIKLGLTNPKDLRYVTDCPPPGDIIIGILYVIVAALIVAQLMLKWLVYIPLLGKEMIGTSRIEASVPGEESLKQGVKGLQHGIERMRKPKSGGGDD